MKSRIKRQVGKCVDELREGKLTEESLNRILEILDGAVPERQDLLYLQSVKTVLTSEVIGMLIVEDGEVSEGPPDPKDWPYQTVLDAVRDGWRIIKFPEMALLLDEERTYGLGCEFILERLR